MTHVQESDGLCEDCREVTDAGKPTSCPLCPKRAAEEAVEKLVGGPPMVGLCPGDHFGDFYMPLDVGESTVCPTCDLVMIIYKRLSDPGALRGINTQRIKDRL